MPLNASDTTLHLYACRQCGKKFQSQGIKNHEKTCLPIFIPRSNSRPKVRPAPVISFSPPSPKEPIEQSARFEFPKMLYKMLHDCTFDERYSHIVSWQAHGLAFKVHKREELEKILPGWFREKYESWRCLLEQWGFLKLSRGKDRGCWYHKKFYYHRSSNHSKKSYESVDKEDFIKGMPEYLSFRDEPDLEKESTSQNRIPTTMKYKEPKQAPEKDSNAKKIPVANKQTVGSDIETAKVVVHSDKSTDRYRLSTLKECRHCHQLFAAQGFRRHENGCTYNPKNEKIWRYRMSSLKECPHCLELFSSQGFRKHEEHCRLTTKRKSMDDNSEHSSSYAEESEQNSSSESEDGDDSDDDVNQDMVKCRHCKLFFSKYGVKKHETYCEKKCNRSVKLENQSDDRIPCKYCGVLFSKFGIKTHERHCRHSIESNGSINDNENARTNDNDTETNHEDSLSSDESSVDSIESGCKICGFDDDHANLLLCEGCDTEVHTYCLTPPLEKVPTGDWFCDSCKFRMRKAEEEFGDLVRNLPPEMSERFGEICFAKSAENAHWWPALIFDPRSFLHNHEVVDLARRNLGKRFLVFFFENQDAFAAIPQRWIMTWDQAVEKGFDKGKSVRHASNSRKLQFERAMNLAKEAFDDGSSHDLEFSSSESHDSPDSGSEERSLSPRIPRVIGGSTSIFDLCPDFDWRLIRDEVRQEIEARYPEEARKKSKASKTVQQSLVRLSGKNCWIGYFSNPLAANLAVKLFKEKIKAAMDTFDNGNATASPSAPKRRSVRRKINDISAPEVVEPAPMTEIGFGTFTDKKPMGRKSRSVAKACRNNETNTNIDHVLQQKPEKQQDSQEEKEDPLPEKIPTPPPLSDRERNELLMKTSLCQYYLLPLSQL